MFCANCGNNLPDGTQFCSRCGQQQQQQAQQWAAPRYAPARTAQARPSGFAVGPVIGIVAALLALGGFFLPWVSALWLSVNGWDVLQANWEVATRGNSSAWADVTALVLVLACACLLALLSLISLGKRRGAMPGRIVVAIVGLVAAVIWAAAIGGGNGAPLSYGVFLSMAGFAVSIVGAAI